MPLVSVAKAGYNSGPPLQSSYPGLTPVVMLRLTTLGGLSVHSGEAKTPVVSRPRHLALLCLLAASASRGVSRDRILALLWPELDTEHGRNALNQLLFGLRRDLGDVVVGRAELRLNAAALPTDLEEFEAAIHRGDLGLAAELYRGPLADGFHISGAPLFERWLDEERARLARRSTGVLEQVAADLEKSGNWHEASKYRWRIAETDPLNSRAALNLIRTLAATGDRVGASELARRHEEMLRNETGAGVAPQMARLIEELLLEDRAVPVESKRPIKPLDAVATPVSSHLPISSEPVAIVEQGQALPRRRVTSRVLLGASIPALAFGGLLMVRSGWISGGTQEPRVQRVAVLPFTVRGSTDAGFMRTGLVELLARSLDGAAGIQTVDPRAVLRAAERDSLASRDVRLALKLADRLHATRVILGDVFASGSTVRISASLYDDRSAATPLATATVEGNSENLLGLADDLAARLMVSGGGDARQRAFDAGYRSTRSLAALKAYLTGEARRRDGQYSEAIAAFEDAVRQDSTFALAYYALSNAADWAGRPDLIQPAARQAQRFVSRLTDHDRMLVQAYCAWRQNRSEEAERLYESLLNAHPDDAESWYQLGELLFHDNSRRGRSFAESRSAFEQVIALQPDDRESLIHLARIAARTEGPRAVDSIVAMGLRVASPADARELRALRAFAHDDTLAQRASLRDFASVDVHSLAILAWRVAMYATNLAGAERIIRLGARDDHPMMMQADARAPLTWILLGRGQFESASEQASLMETGGARLATEALLLRSMALIAPDRSVPAATARRARGQLDSAVVAQLARRAPTDSDYAYDIIGISGLLAVQSGDLAVAKRVVAELEDLQLIGNRRRLAHASAVGIRARVDWAEGRRKQALDAMLDGRREGVVETRAEGLDRFFIAEMLLSLSRDNEAAPWLSTMSERGLEEMLLFAPAERRLAAIAEKQGNLSSAREHYARFLRLWGDGDPEVRPLIDGARQRLTRIAAQ